MGAERILRGLAPFLVLVLGLSGSRGGALAFAVGLLVLVALVRTVEEVARRRDSDVSRRDRRRAWGGTVAAGGGGALLVIAAAGAMMAGAAIPTPGRRSTLVLLCGLAVAVAVAIAVQPPSTSVELPVGVLAGGPRRGPRAAAPRERRGQLLPLLAGAPKGRDLASATPTASTSRRSPSSDRLGWRWCSPSSPSRLRRRFAGGADPLVATAGAGFAVFALHAGIDWDWEMPVVTLVALGCGGTVLAVGCEPTSRRRTR